MRNNVAYLRVSTESQTEKYGLDVQKQKIVEYCDKKGEKIDKWYIDGGYSGSKLDRPKINELLLDAENGKIKKVFIYKLDRMSRDVIDTLTLLYRVLPQYGIEIVSMTEDLKFKNPMDKVMIGVNAIMGQYEREVIYMRTRAGMIERVKRGLWMGGGRVPFGYYYDRNDGILHPKEDEAELVRKAYRLYIDGYSCDRISRILGFKGERIVIQILKRKSNIGMIEYKGEVYKGLHKPIIDDKTFYQAQECMKKRHTNSHINNNNMLTGLCYCGICGARMRYMKWNDGHRLVCYSKYSGKEYMKRSNSCTNEVVRAEIVEKEVDDCFKQFAITVGESRQNENNCNIIESMIKKTNSKIKKLYKLYIDNENDNLFELIQEEEQKVKDLKAQLEKENKKKHSSDNTKSEMIKDSSKVWDSLTNREKNKILKECIEKIVLNGNDISIHFISI